MDILHIINWTPLSNVCMSTLVVSFVGSRMYSKPLHPPDLHEKRNDEPRSANWCAAFWETSTAVFFRRKARIFGVSVFLYIYINFFAFFTNCYFLIGRLFSFFSVGRCLFLLMD